MTLVNVWTQTLARIQTNVSVLESVTAGSVSHPAPTLDARLEKSVAMTDSALPKAAARAITTVLRACAATALASMLTLAKIQTSV